MFAILAIAFLGLVAGTLVNYCADVLPSKRRLTKPFCAFCGEPQPLGDFLMFFQRCSRCQKRRPWRTWAVIFIFLISAIQLWQFPPPDLGFIAGLAVFIYFGIVVVIDCEHRVILHPVSLAGGLLGLGIGTWLHGIVPTLLGALAGFGSMLILYLLGILFVRVLAHWQEDIQESEGLGFGDVNLAGVLGLLLGWPGILMGLVLTILLAGAVSAVYLGILLVYRKYKPSTAIPYGPFLVSSTLILLFFGDIVASRLGW